MSNYIQTPYQEVGGGKFSCSQLWWHRILLEMSMFSSLFPSSETSPWHHDRGALPSWRIRRRMEQMSTFAFWFASRSHDDDSAWLCYIYLYVYCLLRCIYRQYRRHVSWGWYRHALVRERGRPCPAVTVGSPCADVIAFIVLDVVHCGCHSCAAGTAAGRCWAASVSPSDGGWGSASAAEFVSSSRCDYSDHCN